MRILTPTLAVVAWCAVAPSAEAQSEPAPRRLSEAGFGVTVGGPVDTGTTSAELTRPDGTPFVLFRTTNGYGTALGVHGILGKAMSRHMGIEAVFSWNRVSLNTEISDDVEEADSVTISEPITRITAEGAWLWTLRDSAASSLFVRASGGVMRDISRERIVARNGLIAQVGAGMKYWWRHRPRGRVSHVGVRLDGSAAVQWKGITIGREGVRFAPMLSASLIFGS